MSRVESRYDARVKYYNQLAVLAKEDSKKVILNILSTIRTRVDSLEFSLISKYELDLTREHELGFSEVDPLLTSSLYTDSIIRLIMDLNLVLIQRKIDILRMRKEYKNAKKSKTVS